MTIENLSDDVRELLTVVREEQDNRGGTCSVKTASQRFGTYRYAAFVEALRDAKADGWLRQDAYGCALSELGRAAMGDSADAVEVACIACTAEGAKLNGEKQIETWLCRQLEEGIDKPEAFAQLSLERANAELTDLAALVAGHRFEVVQDSSIWNTHPGLMVDIIGWMTPDIVLRSMTTGENRIIIEVKQHARLGHDEDACQLTRYFLHLLATSKQSQGQDIQRAVILAAPEAWFKVSTNASAWDRFTTRFGPLATHFGVVLAKLHTPIDVI